MNQKKRKKICDLCNGNGFVRVPYELAREEVTVQCDKCKSEGEIDEDKNGYFDDSGIDDYTLQ